MIKRLALLLILPTLLSSMLSSGDELSDSYAEAQYLQGVMYDTGEGVQQDSQAALRLYILAADQDHAAAQIMLGVMYADGNGVPKDPVMAYMWFNLATRLGAEDAKRYRQDVARSMTPTQIAEAQQMTLDWFEEHPRSP